MRLERGGGRELPHRVIRRVRKGSWQISVCVTITSGKVDWNVQGGSTQLHVHTRGILRLWLHMVEFVAAISLA